MYRYVLKQIRDAIAFNVNVRKSFGYKSIAKNNNQRLPLPPPAPSVNCQIREFVNQNRNNSQDDFKKKYKCKYPTDPSSILQALTFSTALIAVNYFSQLICLYRRNHHHHRLNSKCFYTKYLCSQELHKKFFSSPPSESSKDASQSGIVQDINQNGPAQTSGKYVSKFIGFDTFFEKRFLKYYETIDESKGVFNVDNDKVSHEKFEKSQTNDDEDDEKANQIFSSISNIIGEIELQLGIEYARRGNFEEAAEHFKMSTNSNNSSACYNLALLYENGVGVRKDMMMAKRLYEMAANWGNRMAIYNLGVFYANGLGGIKKSFHRARLCFEKAARLGDENALAAIALVNIKPSFNFSGDYIRSDIEPTVVINA